MTKGPWAWQKFGRHYCLTGQHGMRPIVLSVIGGGPDKGSLTSLVGGLLVPLDPQHPDAKAIANLPELVEALQAIRTVMRGDNEAMTSAERSIWMATTLDAIEAHTTRALKQASIEL